MIWQIIETLGWVTFLMIVFVWLLYGLAVIWLGLNGWRRVTYWSKHWPYRKAFWYNTSKEDETFNTFKQTFEYEMGRAYVNGKHNR